MNADQRARSAADLTDLAAWIGEQLSSETASRQHALEQAASSIRDIAVRLGAGTQDPEAAPERDLDLERWLTRQVERARPQPAGPEDLAVIRKLAALPDGTIAEAIARWLHEPPLPRIDGSLGATWIRPDGSAQVAAADVGAVLGALATAAEYLEYQAGLTCSDCEANVAEICDTHASQLDIAAEYRAVATRLGEGR